MANMNVHHMNGHNMFPGFHGGDAMNLQARLTKTSADY